MQILPGELCDGSVGAEGGRRLGCSLSPISPVAFLQLHAELLRGLSLRRGRRGREEVEISSWDIRVRKAELRGRRGWEADPVEVVVAGGANAQVQLVCRPRGGPE